MRRALATMAAAILTVAGAQLAMIGPLAQPASAAPTLTVGPNINVSKTAGNQNEAGIAVDPTNPSHMFMAMNTDAAAFPDGLLGAVSTDGGGTWTTRKMADGATDTLTAACCDAKVSWDKYGNLFLTYVSGTLNSIIVARSTDGGASFTQLTSIAGKDQPSIATGANSVWVTFEDGSGIEAAGASVTALGNTGAFSAKQLAPGSGSGNFGDIAVGPTGQVIVTYESPSGGSGPATLYANLDADGLGAGGFAAQTTITSTNVGGFHAIPAQPNRTVDAEGNFAWDRTGGPHNGRLYFAYTDTGSGGANDTDIELRHSDDNGGTWSAPLRVNDDTTTRSQFNPDISLDPTTGNVGITWHDARNDSGSGAGDTDGVANTDAQRWGTVSADGGVSVLANVQISAGTSHQNNLPGPGFADIDYGDYDTSTFYGNHLYSAWADNSNSTGDNPQGSLKQMDEYVAQVTFSTKASPTINTTATPSSAQLGVPVHDSAVLASGNSPGGSITFKLFGPDDGTCGNPPVMTSTVAVAGNGTYNSANLTPLAPGAYRWTADYTGDANNNAATSGCNAANEATQVVPCAHYLTGAQPSMYMNGGAWCASNATFSGSVGVAPGTSAVFLGSTVNGSLAAKQATGFILCGTTVTGTLTSGYATGFVLIGDTGDDGCAGNHVGVDAAFNANTGGMEIGFTTVGRNLTLQNNSGVGPFPDDTMPEVEKNTISGNLGCVGNTPGVTNDSLPNTVSGGRFGQCSAGGF
jgi:hypothetical protein